MSTLLLAALLATVPAEIRVHTSTADVRACAFTSSGDAVVAATGGGLLVADANAATPRRLTALHGLPGTGTDAVLAVDDDRVWVGTEAGLARVRVSADAVDVALAIDGAPVRALAPDGDAIWVGTWGDGVQRLHDGRLVPVPTGGETPSAVQRRITDFVRDGDAWVVATAGAGLLRGGTGGFARWSTDLDDRVVWSLAVHDGRIFAGTLQGVFVKDDRLRRLADVDARDLLIEKDGALQVATMGEGVRHLGIDRRSREVGETLPAPMVQAIARRGARRCVGTTEGLFLDAGPGTRARRATLGELPSRDVSAIAFDADEDRLWVGTFDQGLAVRDGKTWRTIEAPELDPQINALAVQRIGDRSIVWVGTARGLTRIDRGRAHTFTTKHGLPHEHVQSVLVRRDGSLAVGTTRGVVHVRDDEVVPLERRRRPKDWAVWALHEDEGGTLWIGTTHGLVAWPKTGAWTSLSMLGGVLPDDWVTAIATDEGALWVGTYAKGVARLRQGEDGRWAQDAWLGGGRVNPGGLVLSGDDVWLATMGGLKRRPKDDDAAAWRDEERAAPGRDVTAVLLHGATRWVASRRGVAERAGLP